jgi:hypothetical protein
MKSPSGGFNVPLIDRLGRYTGSSIYKWACDPRSLIATTVSTISKRLVDYSRRHNKWYIVKKNLSRILRVSAYYAITKNAYVWDRVLFFARDLEKNGKLLHTFLLKFLSKLDDHKRFVYSHVSFQTEWLLFRAKWPRDKSLLNRGKGWILPNGESPDIAFRTLAVRDIAIAINRI